MSARRSRGLALLVGLALAAGALLLLEVGWRLLGAVSGGPTLWVPEDPQRGASREEVMEAHRERMLVHESHPYLFWKNRPHVDVAWRGVRVETNARGFRDDPVPARKGPSEYRILVLGESTAFGDRVEEEEAFPEVLERLFGETGSRCSFRVVNAAVTGYSLFQSARYLERYGLELRPDLVMIYHGYNDFLPTTYTAARTDSPFAQVGRTDREIYRARTGFPEVLGLWLGHYSAAFRGIRGLLFSRPGGSAGLRYLPGDRSRVPDEDRRQLLEEMRRRLEREERAFVVLVPAYASFDRHRRLLLDFARETGTPRIDLEAATRALAARRERLFFPDAIHPRPPLHAAFAAEILDGLRREAREGRLEGLARCGLADPGRR